MFRTVLDNYWHINVTESNCATVVDVTVTKTVYSTVVDKTVAKTVYSAVVDATIAKTVYLIVADTTVLKTVYSTVVNITVVKAVYLTVVTVENPMALMRHGKKHIRLYWFLYKGFWTNQNITNFNTFYLQNHLLNSSLENEFHSNTANSQIKTYYFHNALGKLNVKYFKRR